MINVVFLLLIFFMMTARIAPPPPFDVTLPATPREAVLEEDATLYMSRDGLLAFRAQRGDAVWPALAALNLDGALTLRADADVPAKDMAALLSRLASVGIDAVTLAVAQP